MATHRRISGFIGALLIGLWASSGCRSDRSNEQAPQQSPDQAGVPKETKHKEVGEASWYGPGFHGQETASGETFDQKKLTAAHPSLPMGTKATVTNLDNGKKVEVTINDRGPAAKEDRAIDLSSSAANKLDMKKDGTAQVKIETKSTKKSRTKIDKAKLAAKP
ncbi:septal ring lytic transglycosylase RlpA family protein [Methylomonas sp. MO1]|uniref:septal ring lytic transglycosylase RlpA family protein n=1 Tax=unclassified Methylomonas TaxID=2608980 RepID=UPI00047CF1BD|nr:MULTISPECIES: septal ring lytic transglycosylase RlpA family protein [unclassified Methylomonas]MDT4287937.1 septal ring lytic transglycosylase RlpA family protein [Methylomonas sp. MO1]